jgi:hypothetical protein
VSFVSFQFLTTEQKSEEDPIILTVFPRRGKKSILPNDFRMLLGEHGLEGGDPFLYLTLLGWVPGKWNRQIGPGTDELFIFKKPGVSTDNSVDVPVQLV